MIDAVAEARFRKAQSECRVHARRLSRAQQNLCAFFPLNSHRYRALTEAEIEHVDQFIYRFMKLQDSMGSRLFPTLLGCLGEPVAEMPVIHRLMRLEKLGALQSRWEWQRLREVPYDLAHEYTSDPAESSVQLNALYAAGVQLLEIHDHVVSSAESFLEGI